MTSNRPFVDDVLPTSDTLSDSEAGAFLNGVVSRGQVLFAKWLLRTHNVFVTKLSLDGRSLNHDMGSILVCLKLLRESKACFFLSEFEACNYQCSSSMAPHSALAILRNLPGQRTGIKTLKLQQFSVDDEVMHFCCRRFPSLTCLDVGNNELLCNVPADIKQLTQLTTLNLRDCINLTSLPDELAKLRRTLTSISAEGCTSITFPPSSILHKGVDSIFSYLLQAQDAKPLKRVKILFIGNGRSGKTSLLRALARQPMQADDSGPSSTIGVSVSTLHKELEPGIMEKTFEQLPDMTYWDFAGQLEYSAAHDFFLSTRQAVYVIIYSVMDDRDSQVHQVAYWLRTVSTRASQHVRFIIVGTKVDQIPDSWRKNAWERESNLSKKLKSITEDMRRVVITCCGVSALQMTSFLFATAMGTYPKYSALRKMLKKQLKFYSKSIFQGDPLLLKTLRFPDEYRVFQNIISRLDKLRPGLPILELESVQGKDYGSLVGSHNNAQNLQALKVLHDVGDIVLCHVMSDSQGSSKTCLCWRPQVIADVIAKFADPEARLPIQRGCASRQDLLDILLLYVQESPYCHSQSSTQKMREDSQMLFDFLLTLRIFVPVPNPITPSDHSSLGDSSLEFLVPSSLQGRPSFWREVFGCQSLSFSCIRGVRYSCMDSMITVAAFVRAMTNLCSDPARMWGCAFSFVMSNGGLIFVRLAEGRDFVDVVVLGSDMSQLVGESVENSFRDISILLRCSTSNTRLLCPQCCASDMFARSGAVHAFHREQLGQFTIIEEHQHQLDGSGGPRSTVVSLSDEALFRSHVNSLEHPSTQTLSTSFPYQSSLILYYFQ